MGDSVIVKRNKVSKTATFFFFAMWFTLMAFKGMGYTAASEVFRTATGCVIPLAVLKLLLTDWHKREIVICLFINLIGILNFIFTKSATVLLTTIILSCMQGIDKYKLFKYTFWLLTILFVVKTTLCIAGVLDKQMMLRYEYGEQTVRYGIGYGQPNATQYTLFIIMALCVVLYHNILKLPHYVIMVAYTYYIYTYTLSRSGVIVTMLLLCLSYLIINKRVHLLKKMLLNIGTDIYWILAIASLVICIVFAKVEWLSNFGTFSARFLTATAVIEKNIVPLFGRKNIVTDFGNINMIYSNGIIFWFMYIVYNTLYMKYCKKQEYLAALIVLFCYAVYALSESYNDSILMNISLIWLSDFIFKNMLTSGNAQTEEGRGNSVAT